MIRSGLVRAPANRIRNAAFTDCTTPPMPDFWGTDAGARIADPAQAIGIDTAAPVRGVRSLRIRQASGDERIVVHAHPTFVPDNGPYTLSAYLRADGARTALVTLGWRPPTPFAIGREWQRVQLTYEPALEARRRHGLEARVALDGPGTLWLAAPQLEAGGAPTAFARALADDHPLPEAAWPADDSWTPPSADRALAVDGTRAMLTAVAVQQPDAGHLQDIAAHGFDAVALFVPASRAGAGTADALETAVRSLDLAARSGLRVIVFLSPASIEPFAALAADVIATIRALKAHPAILSWLILDEPGRLWQAPPWNEIAALRAAAAAEDPARPMLINENAWPADASALLQSTDAGSVDVYPIGQYSNSLAVMADESSRMNRACAAAGKPSAMWLQLYGFDDAVREPTADEARAMSWATFIHGTRLLCYWIYKPLNAALWASTRDTRQELKRLHAAVSAAGARCLRIGTLRGRVHYGLWTAGARAYLVACNVSADSVIVRVDLGRGAASWSAEAPWFESGPFFRLGDGLFARLRGYDRQVWTFAGVTEAAS